MVSLKISGLTVTTALVCCLMLWTWSPTSVLAKIELDEIKNNEGGTMNRTCNNDGDCPNCAKIKQGFKKHCFKFAGQKEKLCACFSDQGPGEDCVDTRECGASKCSDKPYPICENKKCVCEAEKACKSYKDCPETACAGNKDAPTRTCPNETKKCGCKK